MRRQTRLPTGHWALLCAALLLLPLGRATLASDVQVEALQLSTGGEFTHGYLCLQFRVTNRNREQVRQVEFRDQGYPSQTVCRLEVKPGATVPLVWLAPLRSDYSTMQAWVSGEREPVWHLSGARQASGSRPCLLLGRRLNFDEVNDKLNPVPKPPPKGTAAVAAAPAPSGGWPGGSAGSMSRRENVSLARAEMETDAWFTHWLAYSCYDGILLSADELRKLPPEALDAVTRYVECGGDLLVFGPASAPAGWEGAPVQTIDECQVRFVGFGRWVHLPAATPAALSEAQAEHLVSLIGPARLNHAQADERLRKFPVVEKVTVPVGGISLCILAFAFLAGPVNLFILINRNRRIWLLWTTPLLGVLFTAVLITYFFFSEGIARQARIQALTILNEDTQRAATLGVDGFYCPLPPSEGIRYSNDWEVTPQSDSANVARILDLTATQHFRSGWIQARIPAAFGLRTSRHAAERLPLTMKDGALTAVNGLGAPISSLAVRTADGKFHLATNVAPGAEVTLTPGTIPQTIPNLASFYTAARWLEPLLTEGYNLAPGQYLAVLDKAVFVDKGLARAKYKEVNVVLGISAAGSVTLEGKE